MSVIPFAKPRGRGRPKVIKEETDRGTPELQFKRAHYETDETLDLCLAKGLITQEQHWCGIHLRWLYTLRHGAPGVRAVDPLHVAGLEIKVDDPEWRARREAEYHEAMNKLHQAGYAALVTNVCVHNDRPVFLRAARKSPLQSITALGRLTTGLDILVRHWQRGEKQRNNAP